MTEKYLFTMEIEIAGTKFGPMGDVIDDIMEGIRGWDTTANEVKVTKCEVSSLWRRPLEDDYDEERVAKAKHVEDQAYLRGYEQGMAGQQKAAAPTIVNQGGHPVLLPYGQDVHPEAFTSMGRQLPQSPG